MLDTNVISELRKSRNRIDAGVQEWVSRHDPQEQFLSVITIMELEIGVGRVERRDPDSGRLLRSWLVDQVLTAFESRILAVDLDVARRAARLHVPDPKPERDTLLAATAAAHDLTVVTRNTVDFRFAGVDIIDPWS